MRRFFTLMLALILACAASAQDFKKYGRKAPAMVADGWTVQESRGDLNRDGVPDLLVMAFPNIDSLMFFDENDQWHDYNTPRIAVYWGSGSGMYSLYKAYNYYESLSHDFAYSYKAEITSRGTIRLQCDMQADGLRQTVVEIYRWQNGNFMKIGNSFEKYQPSTDSTVLYSRNFNTGQMQYLKYQGHDADSPGRVEEWSDMAVDGLEPLRIFSYDFGDL